MSPLHSITSQLSLSFPFFYYTENTLLTLDSSIRLSVAAGGAIRWRTSLILFFSVANYGLFSARLPAPACAHVSPSRRVFLPMVFRAAVLTYELSFYVRFGIPSSHLRIEEHFALGTDNSFGINGLYLRIWTLFFLFNLLYKTTIL
jgi:hypothetical protein